jgi:hypothetical protein
LKIKLFSFNLKKTVLAYIPMYYNAGVEAVNSKVVGLDPGLYGERNERSSVSKRMYSISL